MNSNKRVSSSTIESLTKRLRQDELNANGAQPRVTATATVEGPRKIQLFCHSSHRDRTQDPKPEDFTMNIYPGSLPIRQYDKVEIIHAAIPLVHYNIGPDQDTLYFSEDTDYSLLPSAIKSQYPALFNGNGSAKTGVPTMFMIRIPHQTYSSSQLIHVLNHVTPCAEPVVNVALPNYASSYASSANAVLRKISPQNTYCFEFDTVSSRVLFKSTNNLVPFQIHCCSSVFRIDSTDPSINNNAETDVTQIKITSVSFDSTLNQLLVTTSGSTSNVVKNSIFSKITLRSDRTRKVLILSNYALNVFSQETPAPSTIISSTSFKLTLPSTETWTNIFPDADESSYVVGVIETLASYRNAWSSIGFTLSNGDGYTKYPIIAIRSAETSSSTDQVFTSSLPHSIPSGYDDVKVVNVNGVQEDTFYKVSTESCMSSHTMVFKQNTMTVTSTVVNDGAYFYAPGFMTSDQIVDLRGPTIVFIRVDVNGVSIGNIHPSFDFVPGRANVYMGHIHLDTIDNGTVYASNRHAFIGSYVSPHSTHEAPTKIRVRLYDNKGKTYILNGLDWSLTFEFYGS